MRWYQKLFWRIFGAIWLVSMVGILVSVGVYQELAQEQERHGLQQERAQLYAEQVIERYESGLELESRQARRLPIWVIDEKSGRQIFGGKRRPPRDAQHIEVKSQQGNEYKILFPSAPDSQMLERMFHFVLSFQVLWLLIVSLISSLLLAWLIVRPINKLRAQVREVYDSDDWRPKSSFALQDRKDELGELAREMNQAARYVEETLNAQENLLRDVSHELRAPLARLQASAGLAEQKLGEDDKLVVRINTECARLEKLISELLLLSRQQVAQANQQPVLLKPLLQELIEDARLLDPAREISADLNALGESVRCAAEPLSRIVNNLLANAVKHAGDSAKVGLKAISTSDELKVEVFDDGVGVPGELLAQLGQPFKRGAKSSGYGLGLSICQRAARQVGGEVRFANRDSGGFSATLILPLR